MQLRKPFFLLTLLLAACAPTPAGPVAAPATQPAPTIIATPQAGTDTPAPTPASAGGSYTEYTSGPLWLRILSPQDEAVVNVPEVEVTGQAPPDTVVTVNDEILIVPADGSFSVLLSLEEGLNVIEIIASDVDGNEIDLVLTVTYEP